MEQHHILKMRNLKLSEFFKTLTCFHPCFHNLLLNPLCLCLSLLIWNKFHLGHALYVRCKLPVKLYAVGGLDHIRMCSMEHGASLSLKPSTSSTREKGHKCVNNTQIRAERFMMFQTWSRKSPRYGTLNICNRSSSKSAYFSMYKWFLVVSHLSFVISLFL